MATTTRFNIRIPDVGLDSDAWGAVLNAYLNSVEALIVDKRGDTITGALTATQFNGSGAGLTGTAANLSIGGNAATSTTAVNQSGGSVNATQVSCDALLIRGVPMATNPLPSITLTPNTVSSSTSIPSSMNGFSVGPLAILDGVTVTISNNSLWSIV